MRNYIIIIIVILLISSCDTELENHIGSNSVIQFKYENIKDSLPLSLYNLPIFKSSKVSRNLYLNENQERTAFVIPCDYPSEIYIRIGDYSFTGYLLPDDTLNVQIKFDDNNDITKIRYKGRGKAFCDYYFHKAESLGYNDLRIPLNKGPQIPEKISENVDTLMRNELNFLRNYSKKNKLPAWFVKTEKSQIIYLCNGFKDEKPYYFEKVLEKPFRAGKSYYASLDTLQLINQDAKYSYWYFRYINYKLVYETANFDNKVGEERKLLIAQRGLLAANAQLTGQVQDIFKFRCLDNYLDQTRSLENYDKLFKKFGVDLRDNMYLNKLVEKRHFLNDSIVKNRNDGFNIATKGKLRKNDSIPFFYLPSFHEEYFSSKEIKTGIVYINFWATWCKPCVASIAYKNELIIEYDNTPSITFLNVCLSSPKDTWKKMVEKKKIGGINLFANENWSNILKNRYSVNSFPTYFLFKDGVIVKPYCDSPENIRDELKELLNKQRE
ncbi:TlpA family protein disulfide reductase [Saccharicrinis aurantiacus]|uniref:TlpA family protein disulfide reductase n=1 Tax=Saccharicrinis aurantiacus TaxID=1849719 RepID=UPI002493BF18|nr:TlpA disulfide reductase family protein [Saccharicrinis aurantiacus]